MAVRFGVTTGRRDQQIRALSRPRSGDSSWSSSLNRMPCTPRWPDPSGRSASSVAEKRIDWALALTPAAGPPRPSTAPRRPVRRRRAGSPRRCRPSGWSRSRSSLDFLTRPLRVAQHQVRRVLVALDLDDLGDALLRLERQQVGDVLSTRVRGPPRAARSAFARYTRPCVVKNRIQSWVEQTKKWLTMSSCLSPAPCTPLPPRFWLRYRSVLVRLA